MHVSSGAYTTTYVVRIITHYSLRGKLSLFVKLTNEQNSHTAQYFGAVCYTFQLLKVSYFQKKPPPLATTRWSNEMSKNQKSRRNLFLTKTVNSPSYGAVSLSAPGLNLLPPTDQASCTASQVPAFPRLQCCWVAKKSEETPRFLQV